MKKKSSKTLHLLLSLILFTLFVSSCSQDNDSNLPGQESPEPVCEEINRFTLQDLQDMKSGLEDEIGSVEDPDEDTDENVDPEDLKDVDENDDDLDFDIDLGIEETRSTLLENEVVRVIKIAGRTPHPNRSGKQITVSGVLIMPIESNPEKPYRMIVVPPCTYTDNENAPSVLLKKLTSAGIKNSINFIYYWALKAKSNYVVFMPDYPGFGDSHGEFVHPYMDQQVLVRSTLDLLKVAQSKLPEYGYPCQQELVVAGYSQGGYVATALVRELETNPSHGQTVGLLITGGTPHNLSYIISTLVSSKKTSGTYFLPYLLWAYKDNAYPKLNIPALLLEPYASTSKEYFNGTYCDLAKYFPKKLAEVYTTDFIKHKKDTVPDVAYFFQCLEENSIKPWANTCKYVTTHGVKDVTVYYKNTKTYVKEHRAAGGKVTFHPTRGTHGWAQIYYYSRVAKNLRNFK